jgi:hypothetical protein
MGGLSVAPLVDAAPPDPHPYIAAIRQIINKIRPHFLATLPSLSKVAEARQTQVVIQQSFLYDCPVAFNHYCVKHPDILSVLDGDFRKRAVVLSNGNQAVLYLHDVSLYGRRGAGKK